MSTLKEIQARWAAKYGHLSPEELNKTIDAEMEAALANLKAADIKPVMTAEEVRKITRGE